MCFAARVWSRPRAETPEMSTLALSAAVTNVVGFWWGTAQSSRFQHAAHVAVGAVCLLLVGACAVRFDGGVVSQLRAVKRGRSE